MQRGFGSDNHAGVHPDILNSLTQANEGHSPSYGTDPWTKDCTQKIKELFGPQASPYFVFNGTAANVLSLRAITKPYQTILCSDISHLNVDECAGPEFFTGCKLWDLPSYEGKLRIEDLEDCLIRRGDQHFAQVKAVSITQPTEVGTLYTPEEIKKITSWAHQRQLYVHMDGSRLANACVQLSLSFKEMTADLGIDILSLGGTKNGLMMGEAVIFFKPEIEKDFIYLRKQSAQLPSKTRYISAQFLTYFKNDLWMKIAQHSLSMARALEESVKNIPEVQITQRVQSNAVFAKIPRAWVQELKKTKFFYVWDEKTFECRWMTSWDTQIEDIQEFTQKIKELRHEISSS